MSVTLTHLRTLAAIVRHGSFTAAAEALHRTQPAVTLQIKQLEEALGLKLFDRTTRRLELTAAGAEIAPTLVRVLQELDGVIDMARRLQSKGVGTVRLGCLPSIGAHFLPALVASYRARHPGISFFLHDALGDDIVAMVKAGEVEFGVTDVSPKTVDLDVQPLWEDRLCAFCPLDHPLSQQEDASAADLLKHNLLLLSHGSGIRRLIDAAFAMHGSSVLPACEATNNATLIGMVHAGLGVAILPQSAIDPRIEHRLQQVDIRSAGFTHQIAIVKIKGKTLSPAAEDFIRAVMAADRIS